MADSKRTTVGRFIHSTWGNLNVRCANGLYRRPSPKNDCYNSVLIKFSRDEFKAWCWANKSDIESLMRPSIDRLDKNKDYTIDNIRICELADNICKEKRKAKGGLCECYVCKTVKPLDSFVRNSRSYNGRRTICSVCESIRSKNRSSGV